MTPPNSRLGTSCSLLVAAKSPGTTQQVVRAHVESGEENGDSHGRVWEPVQAAVSTDPTLGWPE